MEQEASDEKALGGGLCEIFDGFSG